ncbi:MFS transporter [Naasia sp. SYSU D00948]|uniref:MFS transporter n=1 Tax=Naasia sp. SYSU D00948 TaxID=2817379 RepID=UPI001B30AB76|nr:MFS transporter [Naasia sp. SYSU D00948]
MTVRPPRAALLALLISAQFVVMLDTSIVNVALPTIQAGLGLSHTGAAWTVNAYFLAFGGFLLLGGRLADRYGRRTLFALSAAAFTVASVAAALASTEEVLIAARAAQGISAAVLSPTGMAILLAAYTGPARAMAMSAWGAASTVGGAVGVALGGGVTAALGWPAVFWLTVPITTLAALAAMRLPADASRTRRVRFDTAGAAGITGAAVAVIYTALAVPDHGLGSPQVLIGAAATLTAIGAFVVLERRAADPIIPLALLRERRVGLGALVGLVGGAARASSFTITALYFQQALTMDPAQAGLAMLPTSIAGFLVTVAALPRLLTRLGPARTVLTGLVVLAAGHAWLARTPAGTDYLVDVLPGLVLIAAGVAFSFTPTTMVIAAGTPAARTGLASGLSSSSSQIGAAIGIAVLTAVVAAHASGAATVPELREGFGAAFLTAAGIAAAAAALTLPLIARAPADATASPAATSAGGAR